MAPPLAHKRRVRVDTNLPEPAPRRHVGIPIIGVGFFAWVVAVLAGAALLDPPAASRWWRWACELSVEAMAALRDSRPSVAPGHSGVPDDACVAAGGATEPRGAGSSAPDLVVQEQAAGGAGAKPAPAAPMTCEGAIRAYRDAVIGGDAGPPRPLRRDGYAATLQNGIYLRECEVGDEVMVDVCAAIRNGEIVGVTVQTSPHNSELARCLANAVRSLEVDEPAPELDVSHAHFEARWR